MRGGHLNSIIAASVRGVAYGIYLKKVLVACMVDCMLACMIDCMLACMLACLLACMPVCMLACMVDCLLLGSLSVGATGHCTYIQGVVYQIYKFTCV